MVPVVGFCLPVGVCALHIELLESDSCVRALHISPYRKVISVVYLVGKHIQRLHFQATSGLVKVIASRNEIIVVLELRKELEYLLCNSLPFKHIHHCAELLFRICVENVQAHRHEPFVLGFGHEKTVNRIDIIGHRMPKWHLVLVNHLGDAVYLVAERTGGEQVCINMPPLILHRPLFSDEA